MDPTVASTVLPSLPRATAPRDFFDTVLVLAIFAAMLALFYAAVFTPLLHALTDEVLHGEWLRLVQRPTFLWLSMGFLLLFVRTILWLRYRPFAEASHDDAPRLTVVIPAYNEGRMVGNAIDSVAAAQYPRDRLEIIVIDDGSRDDTWRHIALAAQRHQGLVRTIRFAENRGKRAALAEAFRSATGEIVVTIDSDSIVESQSLLAIAGPFANRRIGSVAGKVCVLNRRAGILPRMLHVRFILAFDFLRSVQSAYGTVYCCPGALSAYRISVVRDVLERWRNQTFIGSRCTYGEDRALTNMIMARGYDSVYQRTAVVHTLMPVTYSKVCRMYLRWTRSFVREEFLFLRSVVWARPPVKRIAALTESVISDLRYPVGYTAIVLWVVRACEDPHTITRMLFAVGTASLFYTLYYLRSERSWDFFYGVLYPYFALFGLTWIFPYALVTVRARSWLTR